MLKFNINLAYTQKVLLFGFLTFYLDLYCHLVHDSIQFLSFPFLVTSTYSTSSDPLAVEEGHELVACLPNNPTALGALSP